VLVDAVHAESLQGTGASPRRRWEFDGRQGLGNLSSTALLRVVGAFGIICFHRAGESTLGYLGAVSLAVFMFLSFVQPRPRRDLLASAKQSGQQLLIPFAGWWLIYGATAFWRARGVPQDLLPPWSVSKLATWPSIHLWYLYFVFFASLAVGLLRRIRPPLRVRYKLALSIPAGSLALALLPLVDELPPPAGQMAVATPAVAFGLAYNYWLRFGEARQRLIGLVVMAIILAMASSPNWLWGNKMVCVGYAGAGVAMILCAVSLPRSRFVLRLSSLTLGIYLSHPLVMLGLWKFGGTRLPIHLFVALTFALSALLTWGLQRVPYLRRIVSPTLRVVRTQPRS
jgi:hypothetical protein